MGQDFWRDWINVTDMYMDGQMLSLKKIKKISEQAIFTA